MAQNDNFEAWVHVGASHATKAIARQCESTKLNSKEEDNDPIASWRKFEDD